MSSDIKELRLQRKAQIETSNQNLREQTKIQKMLREALGDKSLTIPSLAEAVKLPTELVFWHIIALRKFGKVVEDGVDGDYPTYKLVVKQ